MSEPIEPTPSGATKPDPTTPRIAYASTYVFKFDPNLRVSDELHLASSHSTTGSLRNLKMLRIAAGEVDRDRSAQLCSCFKLQGFSRCHFLFLILKFRKLVLHRCNHYKLHMCTGSTQFLSGTSLGRCRSDAGTLPMRKSAYVCLPLSLRITYVQTTAVVLSTMNGDSSMSVW